MMDLAFFQRSFRVYWDAGYQLHCHVNGDAGLDVVLDTLEENMRRTPRHDHRTVIVHFAVSQKDQVDRIKRLGAIVSGSAATPTTPPRSPTTTARPASARSVPTTWCAWAVSSAPAFPGPTTPTCQWPGFVDAHGHMFVGGIQALSANLLAPPDGKVTDIPSMQDAIRQWEAANKEAVKKVNLIFGFGYDNATLAEHRHLTREDLDQVSKDIPVCIWHQSGHIVAINSKAIEIVGTTAETPNPQGGVIRRKKGSQEPDGVYEELAAMPVLAKLLSQTGPDGAKVFAKAASELWARFGYTTADEGRAFPATAKVMEQVANEGGFKIDVAAYADATIDRDFIKKGFRSDNKNRYRIAGAKLTIDGSPQG